MERMPRNIRMSDEEFSACKLAADKSQRTFSDWARLLLLKAAAKYKPTAPKDD